MPNRRKNGIVKSIKDQSVFRNWFETIYSENFERLYRYAFSITKSKDLAEDVVEEVFVKIWEKQDGHVEIRDLKTYLFVSVKHVAIRIASKDPQRFAYGNYEQLVQVADSVDPESLLLGAELEKAIDAAINSLPPHCALVYNMVRQEGKSYEQVSTELGLSKKTNIPTGLYYSTAVRPPG